MPAAEQRGLFHGLDPLGAGPVKSPPAAMPSAMNDP
jgi:hypothetical protein